MTSVCLCMYVCMTICVCEKIYIIFGLLILSALEEPLRSGGVRIEQKIFGMQLEVDILEKVGGVRIYE